MNKRFLVALFSALLCGLVSAQVKTVAVLDVVCTDGSISNFIKHCIKSNLQTAISKSKGYQAYSRSDIDQIMSEHEFQRTGNVDDEQIKKLGKMTGVNYIMVTTAAAEGGYVSVDVKILNVESAQIFNAENLVMESDPKVIPGECQALAARMFGLRLNRQSSSGFSQSGHEYSSSYQSPYMSCEDIVSQADKLFEEKEYNLAVELYKQAAEMSDAHAQCRWGWCYDTGNGVSQSWTDAVNWYRKSAEQGYARAQCNLGWCYNTGNGVSKSWTDAVNWYRKSAEQGAARAQFNLGLCYANGNGVSQSWTDAVNWYRKSAEQGNAYAQCNLGECYEKGNGVSQDFDVANRWYKKAAAQGNNRANNLMFVSVQTQGNKTTMIRGDGSKIIRTVRGNTTVVKYL